MNKEKTTKELARMHDKYSKGTKYQTDIANPKSKYSLRHPFGLYFEQRKQRATIELLNAGRVSLLGKKVLDIGCHLGYQLNQLTYLTNDPTNMQGTDFIPAFTEQAKKLNPGIHYSSEDFTQSGSGKEEYDLVTLYYVMNSMPQKERSKILNEIAKKIVPGGHLLIFEYNDSPLINTVRKLTKLLKRENSNYIEYANDKILKKYLKEFTKIQSKKMIHVLTPKLAKHLPPFINETIDYILPNNYYISLLRKNVKEENDKNKKRKTT